MPLWFVLIILVSMLPAVVLLPEASRVLGAYAGGVGYMSWLFPAYLLLSGVCSYICYPERRELSWLLVILMLLADAMLYTSQTART